VRGYWRGAASPPRGPRSSGGWWPMLRWWGAGTRCPTPDPTPPRMWGGDRGHVFFFVFDGQGFPPSQKSFPSGGVGASPDPSRIKKKPGPNCAGGGVDEQPPCLTQSLTQSGWVPRGGGCLPTYPPSGSGCLGGSKVELLDPSGTLACGTVLNFSGLWD